MQTKRLQTGARRHILDEYLVHVYVRIDAVVILRLAFFNRADLFGPFATLP
jgi:hypothetical protein